MLEVESFNSDFREYVSNEAYELTLLLRQDPEKENPKLITAHAPDGTPMNDNIPGTSTRAAVDYLGKETCYYFEYGDKYIGLEGVDYDRSMKLVGAIIKNKTIGAFITHGEVRHELYWWMRACYNGKEPDRNHFFEHLIERLNKLVTDQKVQICISYIEVEVPLTVGSIIFCKLTDDEFKGYESILRSKPDERTEQRVAMLHDMKERYRVFTYATTHVYAEESKAIEIARERVERALTLLRFFSMTAFHPEVPCYFSISGENDVQISSILVTSKGLAPSVKTSLDEDRRHEWMMGKEQIAYFHNHTTFQAICRVMMEEEKPSELLLLLRQCFQLFGQSVRAQDYHLKLVFLMVAIESLFSKNATEPITFSIGQRLAFFLYLNEGDSEDRKSVDSLLKEMYGLRSRYLHHGEEKVEAKHIATFQDVVWRCLGRVAENIDKWRTKEDLLEMLENKIFS